MADYDVIIVGSGLAGLTAGLFAARHGLSTLILESNIPGGHLISIEKIEDFPGFPGRNRRLRSLPNGAAPSRGSRRGVSTRRSSKPGSGRIVSGQSSPMKSSIAPKQSSSPPVRRSKNSAFPAKPN